MVAGGDLQMISPKSNTYAVPGVKRLKHQSIIATTASNVWLRNTVKFASEGKRKIGLGKRRLELCSMVGCVSIPLALDGRQLSLVTTMKWCRYCSLLSHKTWGFLFDIVFASGHVQLLIWGGLRWEIEIFQTWCYELMASKNVLDFHFIEHMLNSGISLSVRLGLWKPLKTHTSVRLDVAHKHNLVNMRMYKIRSLINPYRWFS
jgi:hypothetical protein